MRSAISLANILTSEQSRRAVIIIKANAIRKISSAGLTIESDGSRTTRANPEQNCQAVTRLLT